MIASRKPQIRHATAENARASRSQGLTVSFATYIYVDDGISGAEFKWRPGLSEAASPNRPARRSKCSLSRAKSIGREASETGWAGLSNWRRRASRFSSTCTAALDAEELVDSDVGGAIGSRR